MTLDWCVVRFTSLVQVHWRRWPLQALRLLKKNCKPGSPFKTHWSTLVFSILHKEIYDMKHIFYQKIGSPHEIIIFLSQLPVEGAISAAISDAAARNWAGRRRRRAQTGVSTQPVDVLLHGFFHAAKNMLPAAPWPLHWLVALFFLQFASKIWGICCWPWHWTDAL